MVAGCLQPCADRMWLQHSTIGLILCDAEGMPRATRQHMLDEKDQRILESLMREPDASVESISVQVGFPQSTVQKRLAELLREKFIERIIRVVDWSAAGYPLRYWIDVKLNLRYLQMGQGGRMGDPQKIGSPKKLAAYIMDKLAKDYQDLIVHDVTMLLGSPADLSVYIRAKNHRVVLDFITNGLRSLGGVDSTQTFHEAWSYTEGDLMG
jgi:DNA-binding Lrp family transcriptional regulator